MYLEDLDLTVHNANYIFPSYCHLPVICRSLVDRCCSLEAVSHRQNKFLLTKSFSSLYDTEKKLYSLYRSPNIVRTIKSRRLRWAGHVARME